MIKVVQLSYNQDFITLGVSAFAPGLCTCIKLCKSLSALFCETVPIDHITKTRNSFDPLKPYFYIVKLGFTGVYIIFQISAQKHRLLVLVRTASSF